MPMNPRLLRPTQGGFVSPDADARAYLAAVRQADGANLEPAVAKAISDFVIGCKSDGIWDVIKASCILAGARTLNGALVPLKGAAPDPYNFTAADYNRETGLVGNGTDTYLNSNRNNNEEPQNDRHLAVYVSADGVSSVGGLIGTFSTSNGPSWLFRTTSSPGVVTSRLSQSSSASFSNITEGSLIGLVGNSRSTSSQITTRINGSDNVNSISSSSPLNDNLLVFKSVGEQYINARIAFYSIGESINLADLDARVTAMITAIGSAI